MVSRSGVVKPPQCAAKHDNIGDDVAVVGAVPPPAAARTDPARAYEMHVQLGDRELSHATQIRVGRRGSIAVAGGVVYLPVQQRPNAYSPTIDTYNGTMTCYILQLFIRKSGHQTHPKTPTAVPKCTILLVYQRHSDYGYLNSNRHNMLLHRYRRV